MPIRSGIGIGGAQVFDTSGIVDSYYRQYLQKQKEDQAYAESIANDLAKYDTTGLKPEDIAYTDSLYKDLKNKYIQLNSGNRNQRALAKAEIAQGMQKLKGFATTAKKFYEDEGKLGVELGANRWKFEPAAHQEYSKIKGKPYVEVMKQGVTDLNSLRQMRLPDNSLVLKSISELDELIPKDAKNTGNFTKVLSQDKKSYTPLYKSSPEVAKKFMLGKLADDATKYNWYSVFEKNNPNVVPNDDLVADFAVKQWEATKKNPYDIYGGVKSVPKPAKVGGGKEPSESEKNTMEWENMISGAFSSDKNISNKFLKEVQSISGKKATITPISGGYQVKYYPMVDLGGGYFAPSQKPRTINATNKSDLLAALADGGVTGKIASSYRRLSGGNTNPAPKNNKKTIKGF